MYVFLVWNHLWIFEWTQLTTILALMNLPGSSHRNWYHAPRDIPKFDSALPFQLGLNVTFAMSSPPHCPRYLTMRLSKGCHQVIARDVCAT